MTMGFFATVVWIVLIGFAAVFAQDAIGATCTDNTGNSSVCSEECQDGTATQGTCVVGSVCCPANSLPDIGSLCSTTGYCAFPETCNGTPLHNACKDGNPCCDSQELPGPAEECGLMEPNEGLCADFFQCPAEHRILSVGLLCIQGFVCCTAPRNVGQLCNDGTGNSGICAESNNCANDSPLQGDCVSGAVCCIPAGLGETCVDDSGNAGVCSENAPCNDDAPTQGNCVDEAVCCSPEGLGIGDECAPGGTCQMSCENPIENHGQDSCNEGLSCCIYGLNSDCFFRDGENIYEYRGVCKLRKDCLREEGKEHRGRGSCCGTQLRCCKNADCSPIEL